MAGTDNNHATYQQTSFLAGEWSKANQGRIDDPRYKMALAIARNCMPTEQGALQRRSGTTGIIPPRNRNFARLLTLDTSDTYPYVMEFTDLSLRFYFGTSPTFTNDARVVITAVLSAGYGVLTTDANHGFVAGDDLMLWFPQGYATADEGNIRGRVLQVVANDGGVNTTGGTKIVIADEVGNATLTAGGLVVEATQPLVFRIQRLVTTITGSSVLRQLRVIPAQVGSAVIVQSSVFPQQVKIVTSANGTGSDPVFSIANAPVEDGPYADMQPGGGTVSAFTGTITFTPTDGSTFTADDVGRHIRLFSEPPAWATGTTYASGALVKYNNSYFRSTQGTNVGHAPDAPVLVSGVMTLFWVPVLNVQRWVWGGISAQAGASCTVALGPDISVVNGEQVGASATIPSDNGTTITQWQKGLWSNALGHPICGAFHEGRLFLSGPLGNRFDFSVSNQPYVFSPTDQYGNVNDNTAGSYTLNSSTVIHWMRPDDRGIICGTKKGMELISAGTGEDAITPINIKSRRVSEDRAAFIDPVRAGSSLVFTQRYRRHVVEYLVDSFSGRFGGQPLNSEAPHLTDPLVAEMAYTEEPTPIVWARMDDGSIASCMYKRISRFITEQPIYKAWNGHPIGGGRVVEALCSTGNSGGGDACVSLQDPTAPPTDVVSSGDFLYMVTNDLGTGNRMVEVMTPLQAEAQNWRLGVFADQAPIGAKHIVGPDEAGTGIFCTPIGGIAGKDKRGEQTDIHKRATPTVNFPNQPDVNTRKDALAPLGKGGAVWFNGYSALYNLPRIVDSAAGMTLSCWMNIDGFNSIVSSPNTGPSAANPAGSISCQGVILGAAPMYVSTIMNPPAAMLPIGPIKYVMSNFDTSPDPATGRTVKITGIAKNTDGTIWLAANAVAYCTMKALPVQYHQVNGISAPVFAGMSVCPLLIVTPDGHWGQPYPVGFSVPTTTGASTIESFVPGVPAEAGTSGTGLWLNYAPTDVANAPWLSENNGWFNYLASIFPSPNGVGWDIQVYVNDTEIMNTARVANGDLTPALANNPIPFATLANWFIGGRVGAPLGSKGATQDGLPSDGTGLVAAMTELWIAPTGLDLGVLANRQKFHVTDLAGLTYAPKDLGATGATPTGAKPWICCTGGSDVFHINRARKNTALAVYNNYPDIAHQVKNALDNQIFLDDYQPNPPT